MAIAVLHIHPRLNRPGQSLTPTIVLSYSISKRPLFASMVAELQEIPGITVYSTTNPEEFDERCPTLAFTRKGFSPQAIATNLGNQGIFGWDGNYYGVSVTERLGLEDSGGMVRIDLAPYNKRQEVDRLLAALWQM